MARLLILCLTCITLLVSADVYAAAKKKPKKATKKSAPKAERTFTSSPGAAGAKKETEPTTDNTATENESTDEHTSRQPDSETKSAGFMETSTPRHSGEKEWRLRLGLVGGYASITSNNTREQAARDNTSFGRNGYVGINSDFQWGKYLGSEFEGYFSTGSSKPNTALNPITGVSTTAERGLKQYGGMIDVQGRYNLNHWGRDWKFKGGAGYGLNNIRSTNPVTSITGNPETSTFKVNGPYLTGGLEVRAIPQIAVLVDYSRSFFASGSSSETPTGGATSVSTDMDSSNFQRFRLAAAYEVSAPFLVGLQYIRRNLRGTPKLPDATEVSESSNQFLAFLSYEL